MFKRASAQSTIVKLRRSTRLQSQIGHWLYGFSMFTSFVVHADGSAGPTASEGRAIFEQYIDGRRLDRVAIQSFSVTETRGVKGEGDVSHVFQYFNASLAMKQDGGVVASKAGSDAQFPTGEIKIQPLGSGATPTGVRRACAGQTISIEGIVEWTPLNAAWRALGTKLKMTYDPSITVCGGAGANIAAASADAPNNRAKQAPLPGEGRYMREYLQDAVKASAKCDSVGDIFDLVKVGEGGYIANGRPYSTYEFSLSMNCLEGQPEHRYKGRVDYRGEVRFVVRIDPPL